MKLLVSILVAFFILPVNAQKKKKNSISQAHVVLDTLTLQYDKFIAAISQTYCTWGDTTFMKLHLRKNNYIFKSGLYDGLYVAAFFNKKQDWGDPVKDTALVVTIKNGLYNGLLRRWDKKTKHLIEECQYKNGLINGYRKLYHYDEKGNKYTNIEIYKNGIPVKVLLIEW